MCECECECVCVCVCTRTIVDTHEHVTYHLDGGEHSVSLFSFLLIISSFLTCLHRKNHALSLNKKNSNSLKCIHSLCGLVDRALRSV